MAGSRRCVSARQLGLLLWKNSILKRRSHFGKAVPIFLVVEIIWPILLFVILAVMRSKFPAQDVDAAVFRPFALPSAGTLPFLQSAICDFRGQPQANYTDMPVYPNASVNEFYSLLERIDVVRSWNDVCSDLRQQIVCFTAEARLQSCFQQDPIPLKCTLRDPASFSHFLSHDLNLSPETTATIMGAQFEQNEFGDLDDLNDLLGSGLSRRQIPSLPPFIPPFIPSEYLAEILVPLLDGGTLRGLVCGPTDILNTPLVDLDNAEDVKDELCTLSDDQFQQLADELRDQMLNNCSVTSLEDQLQAIQSLNQLQGLAAVQQELADSLPSFSNESNQFEDLELFLCGNNNTASGLFNVLQKLTQGDEYRRAEAEREAEVGSGSGATAEGRLFSPKIFYTPNNTCVQSIIHRANRTFAVAGIVVDWSHSAATCTAYLLQNDTKSSIITAVNELVESDQEIPGLSPDNLTAIQYSLNESNPDNVWDTLQDIHDVAEKVEMNLRAIDWDVFTPVSSEDELVERAEDLQWQFDEEIIVMAGLVFDDVPEGGGKGGDSEGEREGACPGLSQPKLYIRMNSTLVHDTTRNRRRVWRPGPEDGRSDPLDVWKRVYIEFGFVFIQDMVERALMEEILLAASGNSSFEGERVALPGSYVQQMPYPCYESDLYLQAMQFVLPLTMIFAWLFPIAMTIRGIVREKETRLREFMKMMGLSDAILRLSWFITSGVILLASVIGVTILLKAGLILPYSNWFLIMSYLLLYAMSMIAYSFLISVFFSNANMAACVGCLLYFLVFFEHITLLPRQHEMPTGSVPLLCLWSPLAYSLGASFIVQYELQQVGLQWDNIAVNSIPDNVISIQTVMIMLVVDTILYMMLVWYIEGVWPGRYGVAKPFYFPFQPLYWLDQKTWTVCKKYLRIGKKKTLDIEAVELLERNAGDCVERDGEGEVITEEEPTHLPLGISISHLSKTYHSGLPCRRKKVEAVKDLSLNFYEGQITAFLGHNGAGKTTTMSLLTGLYEPSSGTAQVYGQDIRTHMDEIRDSLGLCPQHNILFDLLTVKEHLLFYGIMRGLSYNRLKTTIPSWLAKVGLSAHANKMSMHLSGGMKRKLSILLAFVGESRTIILDEPTSGVDPFARRQIWDFLLRHRDNRTVMLSTHHMDEAEILGDRIAILSQGSLICSGSFEFLRHKYGRGHRLSLVTHPHSTLISHVKQSDNEEETDGQVDPSTTSLDNTVMISRLIQNLVPTARLEEHRGQEMRFLLPLHQARPHTLTNLFSQLEIQANEMGVVSYGLTACSMEEIFLQLTQKEAAEAKDDSSSSMVPQPSLHSVVSLDDTGSLDSSRSSERGGRETLLSDDEVDGVGDGDSVFQLIPSDSQGEEEVENGEFGVEGYQGVCVTGPVLWITQAKALLVKRVVYTYRRMLSYIVQTILPLSLIILGLLIARQLQSVPNQPALELTPPQVIDDRFNNYMFTGGCNDTEQWIYSPDFTLPPQYLEYLQNNSIDPTDPNSFLPFPILQNFTTDPFNFSNISTDSINFTLVTPAPYEYLESLYHPCGIGASVLDPEVCSSLRDGTCVGEPDLKCHSRCGDCTEGNNSTFPSIPPDCFAGSQSRTRIQNLTQQCNGDPISREEANQMLVAYLLGTKSDYIEARYGGISFGHIRSEVNESLDARNMVEGDDWPFLATHQAAKAWHTYKGYHALPAYVNTLSNAILRAYMPESAESEVGIRTYSHPFKFSELKRLFYILTERRPFLINPLNAIFNMGFIAASFVLFLIEERTGKIFHLQLVCGMNRAVYWVTTAIWDLLTYLVFMCAVILLYIVFQDEYYSDPEVLPAIFLLFISYGAALIPWMYLLSFMFRSPATAYIVLFCLNFFTGLSLLIVDAIIVYLNGLNSETGYFIPHLLALPFPSYSMGRSLMYVSLDRPLKRVISVYIDDPLPNPITDLWPFILSLWIQAIVYTILVIAVQFSPSFIHCRCRRPLTVPMVTCEDENVQKEEEKSNEQDNERNILTLRELTKVYDQCGCRGDTRVAVNRLHLSMKRSECFGLLGVNGAGKTTTFRMLTGDTNPTFGDALILGRSVKERGVIEQAVGYCPQVDALTDQLSGRQHLTLYAQLRGIPRTKVTGVIEWALKRFDLTQHSDKPVSHYSGGNRRRLSAAIALLGAPKLLLLDEPTSGVDPAARQFLWSVIRRVVTSGQSVLITTHSMAECEALCSRVGIMVNGSFRCLGTPQQLKSRYGDGYRLKLRVSGDHEPIQEFIRQNFPLSVLKEHHLNTLVYQLPPTGFKLSEAFRDMERGRETLEIHDYSLSQTTLDDVFIHFASQQSEDQCLDERDGRRCDGHSGPLPDVVANSEVVIKNAVVKEDVTIT